MFKPLQTAVSLHDIAKRSGGECFAFLHQISWCYDKESVLFQRWIAMARSLISKLTTLARPVRGMLDSRDNANRDHGCAPQANPASDTDRTTIETTLSMVRAEYTVMPRFCFHQPIDYHQDSFPPAFGPVIRVPGESLPLPAPEDRFGYPADDATYLRMGALDAAIFRAQIDKHLGDCEDLAILDFGCSSGRVLRHFEPERLSRGWQLHGIDIQARCIEWLRLNFPQEYVVVTGTVIPKLPFEDNSLDVIYGISVFTHIKYLWDMWLLELRRVLRPGGLLLQTIHTETAWAFYHDNRHEEWVKRNHSAQMLQTRDMVSDWFHYGDINVSQAFWKAEVARQQWGRYLDVLDILPPQHDMSFQDLMVCRKSSRRL